MDGELIMIDGKFVPFQLGMERFDERAFCVIDQVDCEIKLGSVSEGSWTYDVKPLYNINSPNDSGVHPEW